MKKVIVWILVAVMIVASCGCAAKAPVPQNALTDESEANISVMFGKRYSLDDLGIDSFDFTYTRGETWITGEKMYLVDFFDEEWLITKRGIDVRSTLESFAEAYEGVLVRAEKDGEIVNTTADELYQNPEQYFKDDIDIGEGDLENEVTIPVYVDSEQRYLLNFYFYKFDPDVWSVHNIIIRKLT